MQHLTAPQQHQVDALSKLTLSNNQLNFDSMFASILIFDGSKKYEFLNGLKAEELFIYKMVDIKVETLGRSKEVVKECFLIMTHVNHRMILGKIWRWFLDLTLPGHAAAKEENMCQKQEKHFIYVHWYSTVYYATNKELAGKIWIPQGLFLFGKCQKFAISDKVLCSTTFTRNLQEHFEKALCLEGG